MKRTAIRSKRIHLILFIAAISSINIIMQSGIALAKSAASRQPYQLLKKTRLSKDSFLLRYGLPEGRTILGINPFIPTCIKVGFQPPEDTGHKALSKSYSPVSHPSQEGHFDLVVKSYPYQEGGGVGKYLCDMEVGSSIQAQLKPERMMHGSPEVLGRGWKHIGLVAGGTGIAPLLQIARIALESKTEERAPPRVHLLFINHTDEDILGRDEIEALARDHPDNFFVTYSFTRGGDQHDDDGEDKKDDDDCGTDGGTCSVQLDGKKSSVTFTRGRGDAKMAAGALPEPSSSSSTMVLVCGRDGFVAHWAGPVGRAPATDGNKGPKIQGPLSGVLAQAGFTAEQVFKY